MDLIELIIDEDQELDGVQAVSLVSDPAIESDFVALKKQKVALAVVNDDKHILMGAALIPDKPIFRADDGGGYHIFFSEKTVRQASELFLKNGLQSESTLEHQVDLQGNTVVESWIKEDEIHDKSVKFGIDAPVGSWIISMKIKDDDVYNLAKSGEIRGFSIEGYFADKLVESKKQVTEIDLYNDIMELIGSAEFKN